MIRFQQNSIERIRRDFRDNILYSTISSSFPRAITGQYALSAEQVFVEVIQLLDNLKEYQEDIDWQDLYDWLLDECSRSCSDISEDQLHAVASIIIVVLGAVLLHSPYRFYKNTGKLLLKQYNDKNENTEHRQKIMRMVEAIDKAGTDICQWIVNYMRCNAFLSEILNQYIEQESTKTYPHKFKYLNKNVDKAIIEEIETQFHRVATDSKHPSKDLIHLLRFDYHEYITLKGVGAKNVWKEFRDFYGLKQSYPTFSSHYPISLK